MQVQVIHTWENSVVPWSLACLSNRMNMPRCAWKTRCQSFEVFFHHQHWSKIRRGFSMPNLFSIYCFIWKLIWILHKWRTMLAQNFMVDSKTLLTNIKQASRHRRDWYPRANNGMEQDVKWDYRESIICYCSWMVKCNGWYHF